MRVAQLSSHCSPQKSRPASAVLSGSASKTAASRWTPSAPPPRAPTPETVGLQSQAAPVWTLTPPQPQRRRPEDVPRIAPAGMSTASGRKAGPAPCLSKPRRQTALTVGVAMFLGTSLFYMLVSTVISLPACNRVDGKIDILDE